MLFAVWTLFMSKLYHCFCCGNRLRASPAAAPSDCTKGPSDYMVCLAFGPVVLFRAPGPFGSKASPACVSYECRVWNCVGWALRALRALGVSSCPELVLIGMSPVRPRDHPTIRPHSLGWPRGSEPTPAHTLRDLISHWFGTGPPPKIEKWQRNGSR